MNVLSIDTASPVTGMALLTPHVEWSWSKRMVKGADAELLAQLEDLVLRYPIDRIALTTGPGAFTSLRVGVSIALGFAMAKQIQIVPLSSLQVRSKMWPHECCLALLDASRGKVYAQTFDSTTDIPLPLTSAKDVPLAEVLPKQTFIAVGEGAKVYADEIRAAGGFVPCDADRTPVLTMAKLAMLMEDHAVDPEEITVDYIRGASAVPPKQLGVPLGTPAQ